MTAVIMGREIPENRNEILQPKHTVVVVHDMQNDFTAPEGAYAKLGQAIDVSGILPSLVEFVRAARESGVKIMYTNYTSLPGFASLDAPLMYTYLAAFKDPSIPNPLANVLDGTWGWQTIDELTPREDDVIIRKYRVDSFVGSNFELMLRSNGIKTIIHTGISTYLGILPTALHATNLGFFTVLPEDCTTSGWSPGVHEDAMKILRRRVTIVTTSPEIVETWG